jgi:hypothetical protein
MLPAQSVSETDVVAASTKYGSRFFQSESESREKQKQSHLDHELLWDALRTCPVRWLRPGLYHPLDPVVLGVVLDVHSHHGDRCPEDCYTSAYRVAGVGGFVGGDGVGLVLLHDDDACFEACFCARSVAEELPLGIDLVQLIEGFWRGGGDHLDGRGFYEGDTVTCSGHGDDLPEIFDRDLCQFGGFKHADKSIGANGIGAIGSCLNKHGVGILTLLAEGIDAIDKHGVDGMGHQMQHIIHPSSCIYHDGF